EPDHALIRDSFKRLHGIPMACGLDGNKTYSLIPLSDAAAARFDEWRRVHHQAEKEAAGMYLSWLGKMPGVVLRLAGTLAFLKWSVEKRGTAEPKEIGEAIIDDAITLVDEYFKPMAERVFGDAALPADERNAAAVARLIHARKIGTQKDGRY